MIKKILKIKNVGRFKQFCTRNDVVAFEENTLIFGYNTYGKSTLTAIFKSLKSSNKDCIIGRKTFSSGSGVPQEVEILLNDNNKKSFPSNWQYEDLEIFDSDFIGRNVFYGDEIYPEQQSNLYSILIDENIRLLQEEIQREKSKQTNAESEKNNIKNKYVWSSIMPFEAFLKTAEDKEINKKIIDIQEAIKQQENIKNLKILLTTTPLKSDFSNLKSIFYKTLNLSVEKSIKDHIERNWKNPTASVDFLNTGVNLLNDSQNCVFCGQNLNPVNNLIENFKKIFSEEYKNLKDMIVAEGNKFLVIDIEKELFAFKGYGLDLSSVFSMENFSERKAAVDQKIKKKQQDLNFKIDFKIDEDFILFESEFEKIKKYLLDYDKNLENCKDTQSLKSDLKKLECEKYRFSLEGNTLCKQYKDKIKEIETIKKVIKEKNKELDSKVDDVFKKNKENINGYLKFIGANFRVEKFNQRTHMGTKVFIFVIIILYSMKPISSPPQIKHQKIVVSLSIFLTLKIHSVIATREF